jgi:hypothetical protein
MTYIIPDHILTTTLVQKQSMTFIHFLTVKHLAQQFIAPHTYLVDMTIS